MRTTTFVAVGAAFVIGLGASSMLSDRAVAQDAGAQPTPEQIAEMMAMYDRYTSPGDAHEALQRFVGNWDVEITMVGMPGGGKSTASASVESVYDGRFVKEEIAGTMMGQPFSGVGFLGYDVYKNKYTSFFVGTQSTAVYHSEGLLAPDGKTYIFHGLMDEFLTDEHDKTVRYVRRWVDDDTFEYEVHDPYIAAMGGETLVIRFRYTRAQ